MEYLKIEVAGKHPLLGECQLALLGAVWKRYGLPEERGARVLDIGPGTGFYSKWFLGKGMHVSAVDIDTLRERELREAGVSEFKRVDLRDTPLPFDDGSFDLVWCSHVIEHLPDTLKFLVDCGRVTRPGGHILVRTPDLRSVGFDFWNDPTHLHPFVVESLAKLVTLAELDLEGCSNCDLPGVRGLHRIRAYRWWPQLLWKGPNLLAVVRKPSDQP